MSNEKFKVKIIKIYEPSYNSHLNPFSPTREVQFIRSTNILDCVN